MTNVKLCFLSKLWVFVW